MPDPALKLPPGATLVNDGNQPSIPLPPGASLVSQGAQPPAAPQPQPQFQQQPQQPGFFKRLGQSVGIPTSKQELQAMVPQTPGDLADVVLGGAAGVGQRILQNYAQTAGRGIKEGYQEADEADQQRNAGQITTGQAFGKTLHGASHALLQSIPLIGPSVETAAEDIGQRNYAGAAGGLTGVAAQAAAPAIANKIPPNSVLGRMLLLGKTPEGAYESAMKPGTTIPAAARTQLASTGLAEGIPVSKNGVAKLSGLIDDVNNQIAQKISADPARPIDPQTAVQNLAGTRQRFANQVTPGSDLRAIDEAEQEFRQNQGMPPQGAAGPSPAIPAAQAQSMKQGTYQALGDKAYGELKGASVEAQKALARGLKEELANQFPELNDLNARDSRLLNLQDSLERAVNRIGNHQLIGIGTPIAGAAASAVTGSPSLGKVAMVMKAVLDNPTVKSKLAIALSQGKIPSPLVVPKIAAYAGALNKLSANQSGAAQPQGSAPGSPGLPFLPGSAQSPAQSSGR